MFNHLHAGPCLDSDFKKLYRERKGQRHEQQSHGGDPTEWGFVALWSGFFVLWVVLFVWVGFFVSLFFGVEN